MNKQDIPAFPFTADTVENKPNQLFNMGMSLRDYFASAALTGFLAKGMPMMSAVNYSYEAADQMLIRRSQK